MKLRLKLSLWLSLITHSLVVLVLQFFFYPSSNYRIIGILRIQRCIHSSIKLSQPLQLFRKPITSLNCQHIIIKGFFGPVMGSILLNSTSQPEIHNTFSHLVLPLCRQNRFRNHWKLSITIFIILIRKIISILILLSMLLTILPWINIKTLWRINHPSPIKHKSVGI